MTTPSSPARFRQLAVWGFLYLAAMSLIAWGLFTARKHVIATLGSPEAQSQWEAYRQHQTRQQSDPNNPVQRRLPKSTEPPALVLMRDSFPAILVASLVVGTMLFFFLAFTLRGVRKSSDPRSA